MAVPVPELPDSLAEKVQRARAKMVRSARAPAVRREVDPRVRAWAHEVKESGDLDRALQEVAASDPELAS